ncbi:MAG: hypothetical protein IT364_02050 [Candidatus Hydrogenedentes bacterium]|nr:hypothetical protein [Candidatus Hydrogenedentota bacterium]
MVLLGAFPSLAFAPTEDQTAVNVRYSSPERNVLIVEGKTYTLHLDLALAAITHFQSGGEDLIGEYALLPILNTGAVKGPGRINIYTFGTQMHEIHLRGLKWTDLDADVELVLYCYAKRVFANVNVTPRGTPTDLEVGWLGSVKYSIDTIKPMDDYAERLVWGDVRPSMVALAPRQRDANGQSVPTRVALEPPKRLLIGSKFASTSPGTRTSSLILLAGESPEDLARLVYDEAHPEEMAFKVNGGVFDGYQPSKGFFQISTEFRGPRDFETAWVNPNQRYEVDVHIARQPAGAAKTHATEIVCNVRNTYMVLEGAVLTDADGYPLPVQVQVSKNFASEHEEGKAEADTPYSEAYFPVTLTPDAPFEGKLYHLFGNWGTHPLKQISSIRFYHHYFHASLGPTETFCYVPFEFPRDDDRNYLWADVRGLTNTTWPGQPQHDHVSVIGALRYKSGGRWINNLLQDTRIYLTSPNLASFALDYLSEDGKVKTTLEIFEAPQDDEARSFVKMTMDVLEPVEIEGGSAQNLRFINAGAYIVHTTWPKVAYTAADGSTARVDVPSTGAWVLEGVPMGSPTAFAAAYSHKNGNMAFVVNRVSGILGGQEVNAFGLSCFGARDWTELFLTAPGNLGRLEKGDHLEAHFFVMPYGDARSDFTPAERQLEVYGPGLAKVEMAHGELYPGYPRRMKADSRGFAQFTLSGGENWTPVLIEGFTSHRGLMLWEKVGDRWLFHDQQIYGNDWYQTYCASDGTVGFVIVVKVRHGQTHQYLVTQAPNAGSIRQYNGFVTIEGGPMKFLSPVRFTGVSNTPLGDTGLFTCTGDARQITSE